MNKIELGSEAVNLFGDHIISSFARGIEEKRQATVGALEVNLKALAAQVSDSTNAAYALLLASAKADMAAIKQLDAQAADAQGPLAAVLRSEEAEIGFITDIVNNISTSAEA